jgi:hypothetical protein
MCARSGTPSKEQSGSPGPPLLELLLVGPPLLELLLVGPPPLELLLVGPPLLDPLGEPLLEPDPPLLDPLGGGGAPSPTLGSTRPMQPRKGRPAKSTGAR